jgi:hypothetical protein
VPKGGPTYKPTFSPSTHKPTFAPSFAVLTILSFNVSQVFFFKKKFLLLVNDI